jgi:hypothetical protein
MTDSVTLPGSFFEAIVVDVATLKLMKSNAQTYNKKFKKLAV